MERRDSHAPVGTHVAASLRAVRRDRGLSQAELARLAGVTASAISQAERAAGGPSLETLLRISAALGVTLDALVRGGHGSGRYRVGRRDDVPGQEGGRALLLAGAGAPVVELVRLAPSGHAALDGGADRDVLIAVAAGLVQVVLDDGAPVLRAGDVLHVDGAVVTGWRNVGECEALLFRIAGPALHAD